MTPREEIQGTVVLKSSRGVRVETAEGLLDCSLRGRFRTLEDRRWTPVVGDRVIVSLLGAAEGALERVLPRRSELERATAAGTPILVAANVDGLLVVIAARDPPPRWALVDRMLVEAHRSGIEPAICVNKWDQVRGDPGVTEDLERSLAMYRALGYRALPLSAREGMGLDGLIEWLRGKVTAFSGHSGVGKTTLLNRLDPSLRLATCDVNPVTGKGRHTTAAVRLLRLPFGGYAVDTPGFREFQPVDLSPPELGRHYPEFREWIARCRYKDCLHRTEPGCAVQEAVRGGMIPKMRYDNYLQVLSALAPGRPMPGPGEAGTIREPGRPSGRGSGGGPGRGFFPQDRGGRRRPV